MAGAENSEGWQMPTIGGEDWQNNPDPVSEFDPLGLGVGVFAGERHVSRGFRPTASPQAIAKLNHEHDSEGRQVAAWQRSHQSEGDVRNRFEVYIHVPFCYRRCGYCDFNTYTARDFGEGASQKNYANLVICELTRLHEWQEKTGMTLTPASSVYFGGGTPTILPSHDLVRMLSCVRELWGLTDDAEVTTEANPDTVTLSSIHELADGGFTRISLGMQSAVPHVLATLDRTHRQENVVSAITWAKECGLDTSLDLIYGAPGESMEDWKTSLRAAIGLHPDHLSCYALTLAPATKMGRLVAAGKLAAPSDDDEAAKYEVADSVLRQTGYQWYEISNWARPGHEDRHNLGYWTGADWAGVGPGAHAHFTRLRTWDTRHPKVWTRQLNAGVLPWSGHEWVDEQGALEEALLLGLRLRRGIAPSHVDALAHTAGYQPVDPHLWNQLEENGLLEPAPSRRSCQDNSPRLRPTLRGRLLNDAIVEQILDSLKQA
jgi:putative oxygen-independent coproporphyrinogen III oxidase